MLNFHAGVACIELKPAPGLELSGFAARVGPSTGSRDPLFARALALSDGAQTALILAVDVLGFEADFVQVARQAIATATSTPAANIMLSATHAHTAPSSMLLRGGGEMNAAWIAQLLQAMVQVAREALENLRPARALAGSVAVSEVSINRRHLDDPIDYDLDILRLDATEDKQRSTLAALFSFGAHPIAAGHTSLITADFPGVLLREIEAQTGALGLYANGASADISPLMPGTSDPWAAGSFERVEAIGARLAKAALQAWPQLEPLETSELQILHRSLDLPLQQPLSEKELQQLCEKCLAQMKTAADTGHSCRSAAAQFEWAMLLRQAWQRGDVERSVAVELQVVHIGEVAIIGVPGELFAALGLEIKSRARSRNTFVLGTTNGNIGYIAPRAAYAEPLYELGDAHRYYTHAAALSSEAGETIVAAALEMINAER